MLSRGAASKTQRAGVKQSARVMLDLQIKAGGDERITCISGARHSAQERLTRMNTGSFHRQPTDGQADD